MSEASCADPRQGQQHNNHHRRSRANPSVCHIVVGYRSLFAPSTHSRSRIMLLLPEDPAYSYCEHDYHNVAPNPMHPRSGPEEAPVSLPLGLICLSSRLPVNINGTTVVKGHSYSSLARQYMILFHTMPDPLLSTLKIHNAIVCLTKSPANPQAVCTPKSCHASMSSRIGPNQTSQRFRMVRLLVVAIRLVSGSMVIWRTRNFAMMVKIAVSSWEGGLSPGHTVTLGSSKPVLALNFGNL